MHAYAFAWRLYCLNVFVRFYASALSWHCCHENRRIMWSKGWRPRTSATAELCLLLPVYCDSLHTTIKQSHQCFVVIACCIRSVVSLVTARGNVTWPWEIDQSALGWNACAQLPVYLSQVLNDFCVSFLILVQIRLVIHVSRIGLRSSPLKFTILSSSSRISFGV